MFFFSVSCDLDKGCGHDENGNQKIWNDEKKWELNFDEPKEV